MCTTTGIPILRPLLLPSIVVHSLFCCLITCWLIAALIGESNHCDPSAIRFLPGPYTSGIPWWLPPRQRKCILRSDAGVGVASRTHFVSAWPASAVTHCHWHKSTSFTHYAARFRMLYMTPSPTSPHALSFSLGGFCHLVEGYTFVLQLGRDIHATSWQASATKPAHCLNLPTALHTCTCPLCIVTFMPLALSCCPADGLAHGAVWLECLWEITG